MSVGLDHLKNYCGQKPGAYADTPFGEEHLVFKVRGKIFATLHLTESPAKITLKTDPELAILLRQTYRSVVPARYFDKRYWSAVTCDGTVPDGELLELVDTSYDLVAKSLKKSDRDSLRSV